jgi:hypothetical protein
VRLKKNKNKKLSVDEKRASLLPIKWMEEVPIYAIL